MESSTLKEIIVSDQLEFPRRFYLINKSKPSDVWLIVIDQKEEDFITIREIEERLTKPIGPIQITDTYFSPDINSDEVFSYFKGLLPFYYIPKTEIEVKFSNSWELDSSSLFLKEMTIALSNKLNGANLYNEISDKLKIETQKFYLILKQGEKNRRISRNESRIHLEFQKGDFLLVKPLKHGSMSLVLRLTSRDEKISVKFGEQTTGEELKEIIDIHRKIPCDKIKLIFKGDLLSDDMVLTKAGVEEGSEITIYRVPQWGKECGDPLNFVDPRKAKQKTTQFVRYAPEWRVARYGLCLEGICKTKTCRATGEYVIINKGIGLLDVALDRLSNKCPICRQIVEFDTCGFNNCNYTLVGLKFVEGDTIPVELSNIVGNEYFRHDLTEGGIVEWAYLKIITRRIGEGGNNCQRCFRLVTQDACNLKCGHHLHNQCKDPKVLCLVCESKKM